MWLRMADMSKKRPKFKKRHKLTLSELLPNERRIRDNLRRGIWGAFSDPKERMEYIKGLLRGLEAGPR